MDAHVRDTPVRRRAERVVGVVAVQRRRRRARRHREASCSHTPLRASPARRRRCLRASSADPTSRAVGLLRCYAQLLEQRASRPELVQTRPRPGWRVLPGLQLCQNMVAGLRELVSPSAHATTGSRSTPRQTGHTSACGTGSSKSSVPRPPSAIASRRDARWRLGGE